MNSSLKNLYLNFSTKQLEDALNLLDSEQKTIITMLHPIEGDPSTYEDVSKRLLMTPKEINFFESRAILLYQKVLIENYNENYLASYNLLESFKEYLATNNIIDLNFKEEDLVRYLFELDKQYFTVMCHRFGFKGFEILKDREIAKKIGRKSTDIKQIVEYVYKIFVKKIKDNQATSSAKYLHFKIK